MVERLLCKQNVAGSIPVASTTAFARAQSAVLQKRVSGIARRAKTDCHIITENPDSFIAQAKTGWFKICGMFCYLTTAYINASTVNLTT